VRGSPVRDGPVPNIQALEDNSRFAQVAGIPVLAGPTQAGLELERRESSEPARRQEAVVAPGNGEHCLPPRSDQTSDLESSFVVQMRTWLSRR
jgi:hypothetical protein